MTSSVSTWGDVLDLALEKALKKQKFSEDVEASKRYRLRRGSGGNIQGIYFFIYPLLLLLIGRYLFLLDSFSAPNGERS